MTPEIVGGEILCCALIFATVFFYIVRPASGDGPPTPAMKVLLMSVQTAAEAITNAASAINTAAQGLTTAGAALASLNDTSALDQPVTDLGNAVSALNTAAAAIQALVPAPAQ